MATPRLLLLGSSTPAFAPDDERIAQKVLWNYAFGPWIADDASSYSFEWEVGNLGDGPMRVVSKESRDTEQSKWLRMVGRTEVEPIPAFPDAGDVMSMRLFGPTLPVFLTFMRSGPMLVHRYWALKEDSIWYYTAWDRKARRLSPRTRYEAVAGTVIDLNSSFGLDAPMVSYHWRYLGETKMLGVMHARRYPSEWCPGRGDFAACDVWEERTVHLVEGEAHLPYDIYSKRVLAIDKEAWVVLATDLYDRDGTRRKVWMNFWSHRPYAGGGADAETVSYLLAGSGVDFTDDAAIRWRLPGTRTLAEAVKINTGLTPDVFNPQTLDSAFGGE